MSLLYWFMNESQVFYMSTNTFSNPIFDPRVGPSSEEAPAKEVKDSKKGLTRRKLPRLSLKQRCSNFCDSIAFSIRSKMFVLELNLEKKLENFRKFANNHFAWITMRHNKRDCRKRQSKMESDRMDIRKSKFWGEISAAPKSRKSLCIQQEKILCRLEQVLQAKRYKQKHSFNAGEAELNNTGLPLFARADTAEDPMTGTCASSEAKVSLSSAPRSPPLSCPVSLNTSKHDFKNGFVRARAVSIRVSKRGCTKRASEPILQFVSWKRSECPESRRMQLQLRYVRACLCVSRDICSDHNNNNLVLVPSLNEQCFYVRNRVYFA